MKDVIVPRSDQLNSDNLLTGPITVKITAVTVKGGQEQPVSISYEGDNGKPYKPCKIMCRVLVGAWGADSAQYVGRSLTLYCDPSVKWGGMAVGGIRISHMSHIPEAITMALTVTKGSKKPFTVKPLVVTNDCVSKEQESTILARLDEKSIPAQSLLDIAGKAAKTSYTSVAALPASFFDRAVAWIDKQPKIDPAPVAETPVEQQGNAGDEPL
jgi:hypothetical protein